MEERYAHRFVVYSIRGPSGLKGLSAIPHYVAVEDEYRGYRIPADSVVVGNAWWVISMRSVLLFLTNFLSCYQGTSPGRGKFHDLAVLLRFSPFG
jgi:hypothetical protein